MIIYQKDPKNSTKILLNLLNIYSKVAEYNLYTKISSIYIHNEQSEKEIRKSKKLNLFNFKFKKNLGINIMNEVK
jgi:hypothetical protein